MRRRDIYIEGRRVRYYDLGDGNPVVLLHSAGGTARLWHRQFAPLSSGFRVIAPDLPGFGGSELPPSIRSVRDYAGFLRVFLDAVGAQKVSLVGSSFGGWIACWYAALYPERTDRLALISPAGLYDPSHPPIPLPELLESVTASYRHSGIEPGGNPPNELDNALATIRLLTASGGFTPDLDGKLSDISADTLIVWGTKDRIIPTSHAELFMGAIPHARLELMEGAGHMPQAEDADTVNRLMMDFLAGNK